MNLLFGDAELYLYIVPFERISQEVFQKSQNIRNIKKWSKAKLKVRYTIIPGIAGDYY